MKKLRQSINAWVNRIKGALEKSIAFRFLRRIAEEWSRDDASDRAGAVAFYAFLSIFPLLLGVVSLMGFFLPNEDIRRAVSDALIHVLPGSADFVETTLDAVIELRGVGGIAGVVGLLWSGSNLFAAIRRAVNRAWGIKSERHFVIGKARDLAMVVGTGALFLLSLTAINLVNFVDESPNPLLNFLVPFGGRLIGFLLALLVFLIIYKYVPNTRTIWKWTWPGTILAAVLFQAGTYLFIFFLTNFANYESVYGPLGSVIVLLMWIYISAIILILGVEVNSVLHQEIEGTGKFELLTKGE
ncbi:YihY/virulence factor BrkB family protein [Dehalogenimonas sp. THU2]|uniref:YihY/virulence factor BrkB family protein n=1 Tax=Dehalogenimonas sp. THU2 TaxID=3151121 RepID=UPI0032189312